MTVIGRNFEDAIEQQMKQYRIPRIILSYEPIRAQYIKHFVSNARNRARDASRTSKSKCRRGFSEWNDWEAWREG